MERNTQETRRAALVVMPPEALWGPIQEFRRRHDRQHRRWPPHVNLIYPFLTPEAWQRHGPRLRAACARIAPFELRLDGPRAFDHGGGRWTLWLAPEPGEALKALHDALRAVVPWCDDLDRFPSGYTPHLSVGQARGRRERGRLLAELAALPALPPFTVSEVVHLTRGPTGTPEDVFRPRARLPLGGAS